MGKFNENKKATTKPTGTNMAGGASFERKVKNELANMVLSSLLRGKNGFYETEAGRIKRINKNIEEALKDEELQKFVAKLMVFARTDGNLRSIAHFLGYLLSANVKGKPFVKNAIYKSILRPDDMTEMVALWDNNVPGVMVPNSLRKAMKKALETKFDEYQFRKYAQPKAKIKLKDIVKLTHPNPKNFEDKTIFKRVIEDNLKTIETAQTINAASTGEDRVKAYMEQIKNGKMGYMAALKNIKNLLDAGISEDDLNEWIKFIKNKKRIKNSKVLPFRFYDAWRVVRDGNYDAFVKKAVKKALEEAFTKSVENLGLAKDGEKVAILLDESASMGGYSPKDPFNLGKVISAALKVGLDEDKVVFYTWADRATERSISGSVFDFIDNMQSRGGGTDIAAPLSELIKSKTFVDKIIILTDMQMYDGGWYGSSLNKSIEKFIKNYKKINPNVKILFWDLHGYGGGAPVAYDRVPGTMEVTGFSDKILELVPQLWEDKEYLIKKIEEVEI